MSVLAAERIKITSTRSPWWCTVIVIVLGLGFGAIIGLTAKASVSSFQDSLAAGKDPDPSDAFFPAVADSMTGVSGFGVLVLMILAALAVTSEYRFGIIRTTFQAMPNRGVVLLTKALLIGVFSAVLVVVLSLGAFFITKATAGSDAGVNLSLSGEDSWRAVYGVAIYAFLAVFLAVGVGALLRQSAAAIALLLLWPLLIESLLGAFGGFGRAVRPWLPFENINHFIGGGGGPGATGADFHWGPWGSLLYFVIFVGVIFGAAVVTVNKRDA